MHTQPNTHLMQTHHVHEEHLLKFIKSKLNTAFFLSNLILRFITSYHLPALLAKQASLAGILLMHTPVTSLARVHEFYNLNKSVFY